MLIMLWLYLAGVPAHIFRDLVFEALPRIAPAVKIWIRVSVVGTTPKRTRFVMRYHAVDSPALFFEVIRSPLRGSVDGLVNLITRRALANLDANRMTVTIADVPRDRVTRRDLVHGSISRPVAHPLRHICVVTLPLPKLHVIPCRSSRVRSRMNDKILRSERAVSACNYVVMLLPCGCGVDT